MRLRRNSSAGCRVSFCATPRAEVQSTVQRRNFKRIQHWKDYILIYEYFHGGNGAGLGASHQTGWTGIIARMLDIFARGTASDWLQTSRADLRVRMTRQQVAGQG